MQLCSVAAQCVHCEGLATNEPCSLSAVEDAGGTCRLCFGADPKGLVSPCSCRGSVQHIHVE